MTDHVKIYGIKPRIQYVADGTLAVYEFPFAIFHTSDIDVYFGDVLQDSSTYTVSEVRHSDGGSVTFNSAPVSGTIITIVRNLSIERTSDFQEGSTLRAKVLNDELDYQIACTQQIAENLNRSMSLPPYADSEVDLTLPTPSAGKAIVWNSAGTALENSTVSVNALESTLNGYKTAAETAASTATTKANLASNKADIATTQAGIATTKATEATSAINQLNGIRTNCLVEIPQHIKLELDNGTLTLKNGSVLYQPNGAGIVDTINITSDKTRIGGQANTQSMIFWDVSANGIRSRNLSTVISGTTVPSDFSNSPTWYDTENNRIIFYNNDGTIASSSGCFPLCIVTNDNSGTIISIDQIFNGMGYIGSTIYILPGVKGLLPNGYKTDGTLNNITVTENTVRRCTVSGTRTASYLALNASGTTTISSTISSGTAYYDANKNLCHIDSETVGGYMFAAEFTCTNSVITSLTPKTTFHAVDFNELTATTLLTKGMRVIIKSYTNGSDWYRVWSDGFIEQGGIIEDLTDSWTLTFLHPFSTTDYVLLGQEWGADATGNLGILSQTTTHATGNHIGNGTTIKATWFACGY